MDIFLVECKGFIRVGFRVLIITLSLDQGAHSRPIYIPSLSVKSSLVRFRLLIIALSLDHGEHSRAIYISGLSVKSSLEVGFVS